MPPEWRRNLAPVGDVDIAQRGTAHPQVLPAISSEADDRETPRKRLASISKDPLEQRLGLFRAQAMGAEGEDFLPGLGL